MQQMFGSDNHYIQDEGCGHEIILVRPVNSGENTGGLVLHGHTPFRMRGKGSGNLQLHRNSLTCIAQSVKAP